MNHTSSIVSLRELVQSNDNKIVNISPKGYALRNGIDYCCIVLKSIDGTDFMIQAHGKDARELHEEGILLCTTANLRHKVA